jgi:hypothetical protein
MDRRRYRLTGNKYSKVPIYAQSQNILRQKIDLYTSSFNITNHLIITMLKGARHAYLMAKVLIIAFFRNGVFPASASIDAHSRFIKKFQTFTSIMHPKGE